MIIDVAHVQPRRVGGQHRRAELALQGQRVARPGDRGQPGPQRAQAGEPADPGEDPGLGRDQVLGPLGGGGAQRERQRRGGQQRQVVIPRPGEGGRQRGRQDRLRADPLVVGVGQHRPRIPAGLRAVRSRRRRAARPGRQVSRGQRDQLAGGREPGSRRRTRLRGGPRLRLRRRGPARLRLRLAGGQLLLHGGRAQAAEHRGLGDAQPAGDLAVGGAPGPPPGRLLPGVPGQLAGPARSPH